jgi:hypothetical protein
MTRVPDDIANLPAWVRRRDGSQVPFEADRICQSLYAAAESLGTASPFLIRELTDVVLHFLAQQDFGATPTTLQIADEVEKIVREVGQPALARRYADLQKHTESVLAPAESKLPSPAARRRSSSSRTAWLPTPSTRYSRATSPGPFTRGCCTSAASTCRRP